MATVFSRLKSNRKYLGYYEEKDCLKIYNNKQFKNELYTIWRELDDYEDMNEHEGQNE